MNFTLNLDNLKELPFDKYGKAFTITVDGEKYQMSRFVADLLSPIIRKFHFTDETIEEFTINTKFKAKSNQNNFFQDFLNLSNFESKNIDELHQKYYIEYFLQLGNVQEYLKLFPSNFDEITPSNIIDRLEMVTEIKNTETKTIIEDRIRKLIDYSALHFIEIPKEKLRTLNENLIDEILRSESLKLDEEDTLLSFILDLYKQDDKYSNLFEYVEFINLSEKSLQDFINNFSIDNLNSKIWKSICKRLFKSSKSFERYTNKFEINYIKGEEFKGILNFLTNKTGGNIHENGTIKISSDTTLDQSYHPKNLVSNDNKFFNSFTVEDVSIVFDFKDKMVKLKNYSIKSLGQKSGGCHLKNWVVEASNDMKKWEIIDERINNSSLNKSCAIYTFDSKSIDEFYRYVRLRQTGLNWRNDYTVAFQQIEFYGIIQCPIKMRDIE